MALDLVQIRDYKPQNIYVSTIELGESKTFYNHMSDILIELGEVEET